MNELEFIRRVLWVFDEYDCHDSIFWRAYDDPAKPVGFFVLCNDFFAWACSDCEEITPENLPVLEQAMADAKEADGGLCCDGPLLFCARQRGMRPQGAYYNHLEQSTWHLFDACGPERKPEFCNPSATDSGSSRSTRLARRPTDTSVRVKCRIGTACDGTCGTSQIMTGLWQGVSA